MVRALEQNRSMQKSKSFHFKRMFEIAGRQAQSFANDNGNNGEDDRVQSRSHTPRIARDSLLEQQQIIGWALDRSNDNKGPVSCLGGNRNGSRSPTALNNLSPFDDR